MKEINPYDEIDTILEIKDLYAKAKGRLEELEHFRASLKSIKMAESGETSLGAQEREAYRSPEYQQHGKAIGIATEEAEKLRWALIAAQLKIEIWRTQQASNRQIERLTL